MLWFLFSCICIVTTDVFKLVSTLILSNFNIPLFHFTSPTEIFRNSWKQQRTLCRSILTDFMFMYSHFRCLNTFSDLYSINLKSVFFLILPHPGTFEVIQGWESHKWKNTLKNPFHYKSTHLPNPLSTKL